MAKGVFDGRMTRPAFIFGLFSSLAAVLIIGEGFARLSSPGDIRKAAFGQGSTQKCIYQLDPVLCADYRSYNDFHIENSVRLAELGEFNSPAPTWLFFGNSFVQAPGMLADTARGAQPDKRIFNLRQNVLLPLRAAQARQLLSAGLRPERIFFVLMPVDLLQIGRRPLSYITIDSEGAIATRLRFPDPPLNQIVVRSRLATIGWMRSGRSDGDPDFDRRYVSETPSPRVKSDLGRILSHLAATSRHFAVPISVIAIPNREQIFGRAGIGFQEVLKLLSQSAGLDYYDASDLLIGAPEKRSLFLPDWHFNERGNALLLRGLLEHLRTSDSLARAARAP